MWNQTGEADWGSEMDGHSPTGASPGLSEECRLHDKRGNEGGGWQWQEDVKVRTQEGGGGGGEGGISGKRVLPLVNYRRPIANASFRQAVMFGC